MKCLTCGLIKKQLEAFLDLNLDLSNSAASVEETLENYITIEDIKDFQCEKCSKVTEARKQLTINQVSDMSCPYLLIFSRHQIYSR